MLTNGQKRALHAAARQAGLIDEQRRLIQWNVGGFYSAADRTASRHGYILVMAHLEGLCGGRLLRCTGGYWQAEALRARPDDALRWAIRREAERLGWTMARLNAWIAGPHMADGRCSGLADCPRYWLTRALDGLKAMATRDERPVPTRATAR